MDNFEARRGVQEGESILGRPKFCKGIDDTAEIELKRSSER